MSTHYNQDINGWIILDKPQGISSNQALRKVQYLLHAKKAGHIGTLDPFATGVLPLAFGEATKLIPYLEGSEKIYEFELKFGIGTSTDDTEGEIIATSDIIPTEAQIKNIIHEFMGNITQIPPKYSAIHINGERAYDLARQGKDFTVPARQIEIKELELLNYSLKEATAHMRVKCSKGTYVRTLGHDIAAKLDTYGHLISLRRIKNGFFDLSHTILLDLKKNILYNTAGASLVLPVETFLCDITVIALTDSEALKLKSGQPIDSKRFNSLNKVSAACYQDKLIALVSPQGDTLRPIRVFNL